MDAPHQISHCWVYPEPTFIEMEKYVFFMTEPLEGRRIDACKTFIMRTLKNPIHSGMFKEYSNCYQTRNKFRKFLIPQAKTRRFQTSPLVFLSNLANEMQILK